MVAVDQQAGGRGVTDAGLVGSAAAADSAGTHGEAASADAGATEDDFVVGLELLRRLDGGWQGVSDLAGDGGGADAGGGGTA